MAGVIGRGLRWLGVTVLFLVVGLCLALALVPPFLDRIYYQGPRSGHFDSQRFFNPDGEDTVRPPSGGSRGGFLLRFLTGSDGRPPWPDRIEVTQSRPPARVDGERMLVTWVGHASVLVQTAGLNILTDPVWSETAGPRGFGPRRVARPGIRFEDLPKVDLVLVSHNHYDHLDLATLARLWRRDRPAIVTSLGNDTILRSAGIDAIARDWGSPLAVRGAQIVVTRNHHWGSRWFTDRNRALWSSFVVRLPGGNLFFAGDTGLGDGKWPEEAARYGPIRLALIPIGAFRFEPGQMGVGSHIGPIDAVTVFQRLGAARAIGIHWGAFRLSYEAYDTPPKLLREAMRCAGYSASHPFGAIAIGEPVEIPAYAAPSAVQPLAADCLNSPAVGALR
jgi:L-ascorbate metabolism protein UlaG (beta-lactamase superfamily)